MNTEQIENVVMLAIGGIGLAVLAWLAIGIWRIGTILKQGDNNE